ncbi:Uncharacterised protein [Candidatus Tiddalikarchaeum anstoanum]|nr:Uncharacterised protein [Candidatus Tiddalikarchaeum anstoanum]
MKEQLRKARENIVKWKIYIDRARMYINYINFFMIIFLFVDTLKNYEFSKNWIPNSTTGILILLPLFLLVSIVLGYLDTKLGIRSEEAKQTTTENPIMNEIRERLERIERKLK